MKQGAQLEAIVCMVRGGCLAWKRMDQDYNVKIKRKEVSGGMRSILSVPSDSLLQQGFSTAATARQVTGSPSPPCPLYGWRCPPPPNPDPRYPAARHPVHLTVPTAHPLLQPTRASVLPCPSTALPGSKDKKPPKRRRGALCRRSLGLRKAFTVLREAENNARGPGARRLKTADKLGPSPAAGLSFPEARGADGEQDLRLALLSRPLPTQASQGNQNGGRRKQARGDQRDLSRRGRSFYSVSGNPLSICSQPQGNRRSTSRFLLSPGCIHCGVKV